MFSFRRDGPIDCSRSAQKTSKHRGVFGFFDPRMSFRANYRRWGSLDRWQAHRDPGHPKFPHWQLELSRKRRRRSVAAYADTDRHWAELPLSRFSSIAPQTPTPTVQIVVSSPPEPAAWRHGLRRDSDQSRPHFKC
jgi:hypothetical protein